MDSIHAVITLCYSKLPSSYYILTDQKIGTLSKKKKKNLSKLFVSASVNDK